MITEEEIIEIIKNVSEINDIELNVDTQLIGGNSLIDSMGLIQLCMELEEISAKKGFQFDWTSEKALSTTNSFFRTVKTLAEEFNNQLETSKN